MAKTYRDVAINQMIATTEEAMTSHHDLQSEDSTVLFTVLTRD